MNLKLMKGLSAHERLPSTYVNVGFCDFHSCIVNFYFHVLLTKKDRPRINFGRFTDDLF